MTELGNRLKEARLEKGLSLDDLQTLTKIQKRYLVGIEEGNYSMMPGPFYVRAFIKQYAEAVDLEPEEIFEEFKGDIPSSLNDDIPEKLSRSQSRKNIPMKNSKVFDILPKVLITIFVLGVLFLVWYFFPKAAGDKSEEPVKDTQETKIEQKEELSKKQEETNAGNDEKTSTAQDEDAKTGEAAEDTDHEATSTQELSVVQTNGKETVYELKNADKFELKVVSTGETWVNILNGQGASQFQGMLKKGGEESKIVDFTNDTEAVIVVGNSVNTEIYVNDQKLEFATPPAEQVRQDITIRYVQAGQ